MLLFLASVLEQLDLALEHVSKRDVHNARFGLMLTDNVVELILHQIAKDKATDLKMWSFRQEEYPHQKALDNALGRKFGEKTKFARLENHIDSKTARTFQIMHEFRNEIYHIGIQHEQILSSLAEFYLHTACEFIGTYRAKGLGWSSGQKLPERAQKYFTGDSFFPGSWDDYYAGCKKIGDGCDHDPQKTIVALADQMESIVADQDICIDIIANGVYEGQQRTRDKAVVETQAWRFAFTDKGRALAERQSWKGNLFDWISWLADNHPFVVQSDPTPSWQKQVANLRAKTDAHAALEHYYSFTMETAELREDLSESAAQAEAAIDAAIDQMRGK